MGSLGGEAVGSGASGAGKLSGVGHLGRGSCPEWGNRATGVRGKGQDGPLSRLECGRCRLECGRYGARAGLFAGSGPARSRLRNFPRIGTDVVGVTPSVTGVPERGKFGEGPAGTGSIWAGSSRASFGSETGGGPPKGSPRPAGKGDCPSRAEEQTTMQSLPSHDSSLRDR